MASPRLTNHAGRQQLLLFSFSSLLASRLGTSRYGPVASSSSEFFQRGHIAIEERNNNLANEATQKSSKRVYVAVLATGPTGNGGREKVQ